jgi:hypothetical protein
MQKISFPFGSDDSKGATASDRNESIAIQKPDAESLVFDDGKNRQSLGKRPDAFRFGNGSNR